MLQNNYVTRLLLLIGSAPCCASTAKLDYIAENQYVATMALFTLDTLYSCDHGQGLHNQ